MNIDVLIATYKPEGIRRVADASLPEIEGVRYVISWQQDENAEIPGDLKRRDIEIHRFDGAGLSRNRNNGLGFCKGEVIVIADDDEKIFPEGLRRLSKAYEENPEVDLITFESIHDNGVKYPSGECRLGRILPKGYYVSSIELSFRRRCGLKFCPELGLNSGRMHCGEDDMILQSAIRRGFDCRFFPILVCEHDHSSTGNRTGMSRETLRGAGCVIALTYGWQALLRVPLKALRLWRAGKSGLLKALFYISQGAMESIGLLKRNHDSLF